MAEPTLYRVLSVPHITDGDTLWVRREWDAGWVDRVQMIARDAEAGVCVRLSDGPGHPGLNTPEEGKAGYKLAGDQLKTWVGRWLRSEVGLTLRAYGVESRGGRLLGDLVPNGVTTEPHGAGAVYYMRDVMRWPAWKP